MAKGNSFLKNDNKFVIKPNNKSTAYQFDNKKFIIYKTVKINRLNSTMVEMYEFFVYIKFSLKNINRYLSMKSFQ